MKKASKNIENFYFNNEYIDKNPGLHQEDSKWKFSVIYPAIDKFVNKLDKRTLNILDVGGGSGQLMKLICLYISDKYGLKVNKYALDLSPGMLASQKRENENLKAALCGNICQAPFKTKKMDLTLMIDILEHVVRFRLSKNRLVSPWCFGSAPETSQGVYPGGPFQALYCP